MKYLVTHSFTVKVILPSISLMYLENLSVMISRVLFSVLNMGRAIMKSSMTVIKGTFSAVMGCSSP